MRVAALGWALLALAIARPGAAQELPILDMHLHYSHDAVALLPPEAAAGIMRQAGLRRAMVSSSDDAGTQRLLAAAPDLVIPSLRPYRRRSDAGTWTDDPAIIPYVEGLLRTHSYRAFGEFHAYGADIDKPVVQHLLRLARQRGLLLHAHSDVAAIERIFQAWPDAPVLWAHAGFERPETVRAMLRRYPTLWSDLAFRTDQASGGAVAPEWRAAFEEFPDRFMLGTDTFTPERWYYVTEHAAYSRRWLASLPPGLARRIAYGNAEALLERIAPRSPAVR